MLIWFVAGWMMVHGAPPNWPFLTKHLPANFYVSDNLNSILVASLVTILAIALTMSLPRIRGRGLISWVIGLTLCWALISTLWLPWIDYAKSYRSVFVEMAQAMPKKHGCIASAQLGESERAMLRYFLGYNTQRQEVNSSLNCDLFLIEGLANSPPREIDLSRWKLIWEGARPDDKRERLWLYAAR
jgi:4-amino-4-deoxy-L-arabinose transferase-like glycosyltransferase